MWRPFPLKGTNELKLCQENGTAVGCLHHWGQGNCFFFFSFLSSQKSLQRIYSHLISSLVIIMLKSSACFLTKKKKSLWKKKPGLAPFLWSTPGFDQQLSQKHKLFRPITNFNCIKSPVNLHHKTAKEREIICHPNAERQPLWTRERDVS